MNHAHLGNRCGRGCRRGVSVRDRSASDDRIHRDRSRAPPLERLAVLLAEPARRRRPDGIGARLALAPPSVARRHPRPRSRCAPHELPVADDGAPGARQGRRRRGELPRRARHRLPWRDRDALRLRRRGRSGSAGRASRGARASGIGPSGPCRGPGRRRATGRAHRQTQCDDRRRAPRARRAHRLRRLGHPPRSRRAWRRGRSADDHAWRRLGVRAGRGRSAGARRRRRALRDDAERHVLAPCRPRGRCVADAAVHHGPAHGLAARGACRHRRPRARQRASSSTTWPSARRCTTPAIAT